MLLLTMCAHAGSSAPPLLGLPMPSSRTPRAKPASVCPGEVRGIEFGPPVTLCAIPINPDCVLINVPAPINAPPATEASVPVHDTPPLVPLGTLRRRRREVTSRGEAGLRIPISEALCVVWGREVRVMHEPCMGLLARAG